MSAQLSSSSHLVIIGAGQAGFSVAAKLRELNYSGAITLLGDEKYPPYQRPPLSKGYLLGELDEQRLYFRPTSFYADKNIKLHLSACARRIDATNKIIELSDDNSLNYDCLVLATGARPRPLADNIAENLQGVYYVRNLDDIKRIRHQFKAEKSVLIVGGGYIGLEAAAVSAKLGLKVCLIEAAERILQRVASRQTADYFRTLHTRHGVDLRENTHLIQLIGEAGRVKYAMLSDGTALPIDFVIAGIGIVPNMELAANAGLAIDNGICVNERCQTSDTCIYAAGDVTSFLWQDARIRLESVGNAVEQGEVVAKALMGETVSYHAKPWFWSDQFDVKLQIAGLSLGYDNIAVRKETEASLSHWYYRNNKLIAVDAINAPRIYMLAKRLIESGQSPDIKAVTDPAIDLRSLL